MPYNGVGVFQRVYQWVQDAANGIFVDATRTDTDSNDIAAGLTNCVTRDGQSPWLANIPAGSFKITGLGNGSNPTDSVTYGQVFVNPVFTGLTSTGVVNFAGATSVTVPTVATSDNSTNAASTAYVTQKAFQSALPSAQLGVVRYNGTTIDFSATFDGFAVNEVKGANIASAATINLTTATGNLVHVTGTTTITAITIPSGAERTVVFDGILTLTHNATTLILPTGANITTAAGDVMKIRGDGSGNARVVTYERATGEALAERSQRFSTSSQLDKTSDTSVANFPNTSATLVSGATYTFTIYAYTTAVTLGGVKFGFNGGTATATSFVASAHFAENGGVLTTQRVTSISGTIGSQNATGTLQIVTGTITVNAAGTFIPQFAQQTSNVTTSSLLVLSTMIIERISP